MTITDGFAGAFLGDEGEYVAFTGCTCCERVIGQAGGDLVVIAAAAKPVGVPLDHDLAW